MVRTNYVHHGGQDFHWNLSLNICSLWYINKLNDTTAGPVMVPRSNIKCPQWVVAQFLGKSPLLPSDMAHTLWSVHACVLSCFSCVHLFATCVFLSKEIHFIPVTLFPTEFFLLWSIHLSFIKSWDLNLKIIGSSLNLSCMVSLMDRGGGGGVEILNEERMKRWITQEQCTPKPSLHNRFWSRPEWALGVCFDFSWFSELWLLHGTNCFKYYNY